MSRTSIPAMPLKALAVFLSVLSWGCAESDAVREAPDPLPEGAVSVTLVPELPDSGKGRRLRWSPYGRQLRLVENEGGLETSLMLGGRGVDPMQVRLEKTGDSPHFDRLALDLDRDGQFTAGEWMETEVSESRNKFWSSFDAVVEVPARHPDTGESVMNPYPLSLWYVEDPRVDDVEPVLRYSRDGWMEGTGILGGRPAAIMVTESEMDGVFDRHDSWALAPDDSAASLMEAGNARSLDQHAWLGEQAYHVVEVDPSGLRLVLAPFDPGQSRAEEIAMNDDLAVDRNAPRSGRLVPFLHDFEEAEARARAEGKPLFVDFETTWCGPCKIMDEWVYTADSVVDAATRVVPVKVDGDERLDLKDRFGVEGFPTMILLNPDGTERRRASGYVNVADMTRFLELKR